MSKEYVFMYKVDGDPVPFRVHYMPIQAEDDKQAEQLFEDFAIGSYGTNVVNWYQLFGLILKGE